MAVTVKDQHAFQRFENLIAAFAPRSILRDLRALWDFTVRHESAFAAAKLLACLALVAAEQWTRAEECFAALNFLVLEDAVISEYRSVLDWIVGEKKPMALPVITNQPACSTVSGERGICCAALTQLGAAQAATGFQYTNCKGKVVCMKCGIGQSTSKHHPGRPIFIPRRTQCGPSGCPALATQ